MIETVCHLSLAGFRSLPAEIKRAKQVVFKKVKGWQTDIAAEFVRLESESRVKFVQEVDPLKN